MEYPADENLYRIVSKVQSKIEMKLSIYGLLTGQKSL